MIKKILVTGSSGTIGTRLCEKLLEKKYKLVYVDRKPNKWNEKINKPTIITDLRDKEAVLKLPKNIDLVIHLAANARVYNLVVNPSLARDNFDMLFNILEYTRLNRIKRFMFASSREVYGNSNIDPTEEKAYIKNCESPYAASKIGGEALVHSYNQCYDINFVIFRFSNIYGMYDDSDRVIPLFIRRCIEEKNLTVFGKEKILDFTYIDDAIDGLMLTIKKFDEVKNNIFNLASGQGTSILTTAQLIKELLKSNKRIIFKKSRTGEVVKYIADISKAKEKIGYNPKITIIEGIKRTIEWQKKWKKIY